MKKLIVSIEIKNGYFYDKTDLPKEIIVCSFCTNIDFDNLFWMYQQRVAPYISEYHKTIAMDFSRYQNHIFKKFSAQNIVFVSFKHSKTRFFLM
jgi:hypothetical protein